MNEEVSRFCGSVVEMLNSEDSVLREHTRDIIAVESSQPVLVTLIKKIEAHMKGLFGDKESPTVSEKATLFIEQAIYLMKSLFDRAAVSCRSAQ